MMKRKLKKILVYFWLVAFALVALLPFYYLLVTACKNLNEASSQATMVPHSFALHWNVKFVFTYPEFKYFRYLANTLFVFLMKVTGTCLFCSMAGYAFSKFRFPRKGLIFLILMSALMIPGELLGIPVYEFMVNTNLRNAGNYFPLWIGAWFGTDIFIIFLFRQFLSGIPKEIIEAGRIDGAGELRIFFEIVVPNLTQVFLTVVILYFVGTYNDIYSPTLYVTDPDKRLMAQSIGIFETMYQSGGVGIVPWNYVAVATIAAMLPVIALFALLQNRFIESIAGVGVKG